LHPPKQAPIHCFHQVYWLHSNTFRDRSLLHP
jgi:hypothetical protein